MGGLWQWLELHQVARRSMQGLADECGCRRSEAGWRLCGFHDGMNIGAWAAGPNGGRQETAGAGDRKARRVEDAQTSVRPDATGPDTRPHRPLVDRDDLVDVIANAAGNPDWEREALDQADAVLAYLCSVLTPDALNPTKRTTPVIGNFLHRRIFGEDQ